VSRPSLIHARVIFGDTGCWTGGWIFLTIG
jgi:hypothetical protein